MPCGAVVAEQAVVVGLQRVEAAAHQHRREWRFALLRHVQETGDAAAAFDAKLQLFQLIRQQQRRLFVSAIGEHLRLFGQLVALQVRVTGDAVQARGLQPVFAAEQRILLLRRPLLPLHALMDPFVDPVAVAVAHHGIQPLRIAALGVRGGDARQHFVDFDRADAAPAHSSGFSMRYQLPVVSPSSAECMAALTLLRARSTSVEVSGCLNLGLKRISERLACAMVTTASVNLAIGRKRPT